MLFDNARHKPLLPRPNHSSPSLIARGMEVAIPPGQVPLGPSACQRISKELPPMPAAIPSNGGYWNETMGPWETPIHREMTSSTTRLTSIDTRLQPINNHPRHNSGYSTKVPRTPLTPPLTKSSKKILQLTGYDPRFERVLPKEHQQINQPRPASPAPSDSSRSVYSQPENSLDKVGVQHGDKSRWSSSTSSDPAHADRGILQSSIYKLSGHMAGAISSLTSLRHRDHPTEAQPRSISYSARGQYAEVNQSEITSLRDLITEEQERYNPGINQEFENNLESLYKHELTDEDILNLVPRPLALRPKNRTKHLSVDTKPGLHQNGRDSLEWSISETTSMNKLKHYNAPTATAFEKRKLTPKKVLSPLKLKNKLFGTGNHPLKSPFPFNELEDVPEISPVERTFSTRLSGAINHLSGASPTSPKRTVISNKARRPSGPDISMPNKTGFMAFLPSVETTMQKRGVHFQEVVTKAKKTVRIKSTGERKRESLKKSIVVVGITDQSPDGRVAEWL